MPLTADERTAIISKAMDWNFGDLLTWERPVLAHTFGENDLGQVDVFVKDLIETRSEVLAALELMPDDDLNGIQLELEDAFRISVRNRAAISGERIRRLRRVCPPPIAFGFGHPSFTAKFDHWAKMPKLTLHEVSLLSLGADPSQIGKEDWIELQKLQEGNETLWAAHRSFLEHRDIFSRFYHYTGFGYAAEPIGRIKRWIDNLDISVHPDFYAGLEARLSPTTPKTPETQVSAKPMTSQERDTLLKLIAAMSCEQYGYDPRPERSTVPTSIKGDLERVGIAMDDKTIRKWLKEASQLVAPEYWKTN
jgi:hypothetical protein